MFPKQSGAKVGLLTFCDLSVYARHTSRRARSGAGERADATLTLIGSRWYEVK